MTSQFAQILDGLLIEYIYTDIITPEVLNTEDVKVELIKNSTNNDIYFLNTPENNLTTGNIRDRSCVLVSNNKYAYLNRNLPLQYLDYDNSFTPIQDLEVIDFLPNYEIAYDTIKIHISSSFSFEKVDGYIFDIKITRRDEKLLNLASLIYRKIDDYALINPNPMIIGERLYNRYILIKIPSLYFLLQEDKVANNLTKRLTSDLGYISTSKINIFLSEVIKSEKLNSYTYFTANRLKDVSFNYKDNYELLVAKIFESTSGDYFELYGEYNGVIIEDFINQLNNQPNSDYIVFHEITVNEQIGVEFIETNRLNILQTTDFEKPIIYRPVILNSSNAVAYVITYVMRLINRVDNTQILKKSQYTSYDTKKYGRNLKKLQISKPFVVNKIYNKIENIKYNTEGLIQNDRLMSLESIKVEQVNVFQDRFNILLTQSKVNLDNFSNLDNNTDYKIMNDIVFGISPYDDFILFSFYKKENNSIVQIDLSLFGDLYLNFNDSDEIKIKQYEKVKELQKNQKMFKIAKEDSRKILNFSNNNFYITTMIIRNDEPSDDSVIYNGKWYKI